MSKKDSRAAAKIRHAATKVFAERGYHGATTRAVADELGLSAAALYPHFRSKEELLFAITVGAHADALAELERVDPVLASAERLRECVRLFALWHANNYLLGRVAQHDLAAMTSEHLDVIVELRRRTTQLMRDVVTSGIDDGAFAVGDPGVHAIALISLCSDICRWFPSQAYSSPEALSELYADIALRIVGGSLQF